MGEYIAANVEWNSRGWRDLAGDGLKSGFRWVREGGIPHESWNFDTSNPRNRDGVVYGYVQKFERAREASVLFVTSRDKRRGERYVVGFYRDAEPLTTCPWRWKDRPSARGVNAFVNLRVARGNCVPFPDPLLVPWDLRRYYAGYSTRRQWPGRPSYIYLKKEKALELLKAIVRRHRQYAADNPSNRQEALAVIRAALKAAGLKNREAGDRERKSGPDKVPEGDYAEAERRRELANRILRDAQCLKPLKRAYSSTCQLDATDRIELPNSPPYCEVHHLRRIADGGVLADKTYSNCLVVCPRCHVLLQYGAIWIDPGDGRTLRHFRRDPAYEGKAIRFVAGHELRKALLKEAEGRREE